jgi:Flavin reductase like domain
MSMAWRANNGHSGQMPVSSENHRQIGRSIAGAVSVVMAHERGGKGIVGITVSSLVMLSFEPPLVMFAIQHDANSYPAIVSCRHFGVSVLMSNQAQIAARFAVKGQDKLAGTLLDKARLIPWCTSIVATGRSRPRRSRRQTALLPQRPADACAAPAVGPETASASLHPYARPRAGCSARAPAIQLMWARR